MSLSFYYAVKAKLTPAQSLQHEYRKRKRVQGESPIPSQKRPRTSPPRSTLETIIGTEAVVGVSGMEINPLQHWIVNQHWPEKYFESEENMNHLLAKKKSSSSLRGKQSESGSIAPSSTTPSDQKPREAKSSLYARPSYETVLATKGSFMGRSELGITDESKELCLALLEAKQTIPKDTLFRQDIFEKTCESVRARNEAMVVRDISPLICPSAQILWIYGDKHLRSLNESVNEGWNCSIPCYGPRPQPDYSAGFGRSAFTEDQLKKLTPFIGEVTDTSTSYFMATWQMHLPFLTCEVKCGAAALDIADRQNAHSMTLAVRGIVELFRLVKREKELHRQIIAFSISHDHRTVRIYGHYPVIENGKTTFYRHPIHEFNFSALDGGEKWTAYKFTKNIYDIWMPDHLKRIRSVIDKLPQNVNFEVSQQSETGESGLSQGFGLYHIADDSSQDAASVAEEKGSQSSLISSRDISPYTSVTELVEGKTSKRSRKRIRPAELHQSQESEA